MIAKNYMRILGVLFVATVVASLWTIATKNSEPTLMMVLGLTTIGWAALGLSAAILYAFWSAE